ncbi:MAG: hypothetical protein A2622_12790 [Bdellovibrionales bacterium RIFCSPHIGHO2_01_FULL_40_29]|nr:MAG: hypothetical protein A2622_12790 [Bdellovibrionales bacterium RIFCSPHIGHO2_01_FULL_40_29]OFZ33428.1 MAG: hypothetical protein A3D17_14095 [Bdellovibrionales bacterium RIFCSPHIGHO2_02_FULL_40_15]
MKLGLSFLTIIFTLFSGVVSAQALPQNSVYQLKDVWMTHDDRRITLKEFYGEPVVIAMTYTSCQYSCPMTFKKLEEIEKELKAKGVKKYRMVVASFDSEKDTPAVLKAYMDKHKYDASKWFFITGQKDAMVRQLAVVLGISYQKVDGMDFSHSNEINLLSHEGVPIVKLKGVSSPHNELIEKIIAYENKK